MFGKILIVDDEHSIADIIEYNLKKKTDMKLKLPMMVKSVLKELQKKLSTL